MNKTLRKVVLALVVIPVLVVAASFFLPSDYRVERELVMKASAEAVFAQVSTPKTWPEWTAWTAAKYPDLKYSFAGPEAGAGASYSWTGQSSGNGSLKITLAEPAKRIEYTLDFENGKHVSTGAIAIEPAEGGVKVTWHNAGSMGGNPVSRILGLLMDRMLGPDFEEGLRKLKERVEPKPAVLGRRNGDAS